MALFAQALPAIRKRVDYDLALPGLPRELSPDDHRRILHRQGLPQWAGSVLACELLAALDPFDSATQAKKNVVEAIKTAQRLGNTPAVRLKCYIHPAVIEHYLGGATIDAARRSSIVRSQNERTLLATKSARSLTLEQGLPLEKASQS
jgi:DNA topoisomerase IB